MVQQLRICIGPSIRPYIVFGLMWGLPLAAIPFITLRGNFTGAWQVVGLLAGALVLSFSWINRFRIILSEESLSYRTLFGGTVSLNLVDIKKAYLTCGWRNYSDQVCCQPLFALVIEPKPSTPSREILINAKMFSQKDLQRVMDYLRPYICDQNSQTS